MLPLTRAGEILAESAHGTRNRSLHTARDHFGGVLISFGCGALCIAPIGETIRYPISLLGVSVLAGWFDFYLPILDSLRTIVRTSRGMLWR